MTTQGYGCLLFFCQWADGPTLDDPACSWPGFNCEGETILRPDLGQKDVTMDFRPALLEAGNTSGCCSNDRNCGCMLRGTATFRNSNGEYAKVYIEFTCQNLKGPDTFNCKIS